jgi:hypothetical protein
MEIQNDLLFQFRIKNKAEGYTVEILEYIRNHRKKIDDYESFLFGFNDTYFVLDRI